MDLELAGKTAIVTGGSKGIGLATVRLLIAEGARVVSGSRTITPELKETGAHAVTVDLTTPEGAIALVEAAVAEYGGVDVLINNVGLGDHAELAEGALTGVFDLAEDAWARVFDLHFYSALRVCRAAMPHLLETGGVIVNVSSVGARLLNAGAPHYNVAKAALNALTKLTSEQFAPRGVRALTVSPGPVGTGVWTDPDGFIAQLARRQGMGHREFADRLMESIDAPTGRISTPEEVARTILFAASPNNTTGAELFVDGGLVRHL
ncbi:3-oxoacyl-ACP reductase [Actinorhabdospora filicis]|uniref:3-oxoacyl-ACP reductase n=1 Tax=Actinorhabdospora filicis TaxID=1785913 RepID=A0A9W6SNW4_9ACTN|nr:SDR family oxidoreductase [Actinorhabdospora filicis]GLZ79668.1 3-oxoacyl-ACP reductase [Actinorhabdospora filicis]